MVYKMLTGIYYQADVKYLQEQYDDLKRRQAGSEASPEDVEGFYHRLKQKTREIMEKLGKIDREVCMLFNMSVGILASLIK